MRFLLACVLQALFLAPPVLAQVNVFACEPEWAALTKELGGEYVNVYTATTAQQDPHFVQARPSLIARARTASLLICTGAELEIGWLPVILRKSANGAIQPGQPGTLMAADYVQKLDVPTVLDRSQGDVHPQGNPHIQTDPGNILLVAQELKQRLTILDPVHAEAFQKRFDAFSKKWHLAMSRWKSEAQPLQGLRLVSHHKSWVYLEHWLGVQVINTLEPKPGIPPSAAHLAELVQQSKSQMPDAVIYASHQDSSAANWFAQQTGIPVIELPFTVGGSPEATDLYAFYQDLINRLLAVKK